jgi:hypothetical protein
MKRPSSQRGQVLLMVTLSLLAMFGMMALAVDLGWGNYVKRSAQKAADAAALAGAYRVFRQVGEEFTIPCTGETACQETAPCAVQLPSQPTNSIEAACLYAKTNGFEHQGKNGRQALTVAANNTSPPPTAAGVSVHYWVTVTADESLPQFWGGFLSNNMLLSRARATAAVVDADVTASLVLLNRENDCIPMESQQQLTCGVDLLVSANDNQGMPAVLADGGISLASNKHGNTADGRYAGENTGGGTIKAPFTRIRGQGWFTLSNNAQWIETPTNHDNRAALDPMRGKGQPPPPTGLPDQPVPGGTIVGSNDPDNPTILTPGNYYATAVDNKGVTYATGNPITFSGHVKFSNEGTGWGDWVIFGGFNNQSAGTVVSFDAGRYIFAGAKPKNNGDPAPLFSVASNMTLNDPNYDNTSSAGELFVFTDTNYRGQTRNLEIPALVAPIASQLKQGNAGFQSGNNAQVSMTLHGLNRNSPNLPADLRKFSEILMWQDQTNSVVRYTENGYYMDCGGYICPNNALASNKSPELFLQGSPNSRMFGTIYQPRGAWTSVQGGGTYKVPVQLIAGALKVQGSAAFSMEKTPIPVRTRMVALVE